LYSVLNRIFKLLVRGYRVKVGSGEGFKAYVRGVPIQKVQKPIEEVVKDEGVVGIEEEAAAAAPQLITQPQGEVVVRIKKETKPIEIEGIEIGDLKLKEIKIGRLGGEEERISLVYPLIPSKPKRREPIFAYAKITFDEKLNRYIYQVIEPPLSRELRSLLFKLKDMIEEKLDIEFTKLRREEAKEYLTKNAEELLKVLDVKLDETSKNILFYYIYRDFVGLGKIEPLMHDPGIEDISCDGVNIPVFVFHRDPKLGSLVTNIKFETDEELDSFIVRLAQLCGKTISVAEPLLDGALPDGSRVQATLATDIARKGSNFTIRKFTERPLTPAHLIDWGTVDERILAYLWFCIDYGSSVMISGGTATGKTTMLNVLSLFIRPENKIVSIEDTPELKLPHPHWVPQVARTPIATGKPGEIDMFTLLKESLRQRPDYIIVGEVRGKEAYVLFQQMATGHPSLATIHAEDFEKLIQRLITPPINLSPSLIQALDIVVFMTNARYRGKFVRRVKEVVEIVGFDIDKKRAITNKLFEWNPYSDKFIIKGKSHILKKISRKFGFSDKQNKEELKRRMLVVRWIHLKNLTDYEDVAKVINAYYRDPERLLSTILGEI